MKLQFHELLYLKLLTLSNDRSTTLLLLQTCNACIIKSNNTFRQITKSITPLQNTHFEFQHQIHPLLAKGVDVIQDESNDDVNAIALMCGNAVLRSKEKEMAKHKIDSSSGLKIMFNLCCWCFS